MPTRNLNRRACLGSLALLFGGALTGCGHWLPIVDRTQSPEHGLPTPRSLPDAVTLDLVVLRLATADESELETAWAGVNDQAIDIKTRRQLDANGIRAGIIQGPIPILVQRWIDENAKRLQSDVLEQANISADVATDTRRMVCRRGKRKELVLRPPKPGTLVLMHHDGTGKGKSYDQASLVLELKAFPNPDGTADLRITPETQHGPMEATFVGQDFAWRREFRRATDTWSEASLQTQLSKGHILMMSGTIEPRGLGEAFFWTDTVEQKRQRILLLVRLAATQLDDRFAPEKTAAAKLASENS